MAERLYSTYQVADLLGATPETVLDWIQKGWLPYQQLPNGPLRISQKGLIVFLKRQGIDIEDVLAKTVIRESAEASKASTIPAQTPATAKTQTAHVAVAKPEPSVAGTHKAAAAPASVSAQPAHSARLALPAAASQPAAEDAEPAPPPTTQSANQAAAALQEPKKSADPAEQIIQAMLTDAVQCRATHLHLQQSGDCLSLSLRIDGVLRDKPNFKTLLPKNLTARLVAQLEANSGTLNIEIDGSLTAFRSKRIYTASGRLIVIENLRAEAQSQLDLESLDRRFLQTLAQPSGLIVLTGPARGGVEMLLPAILRRLQQAGRSVLALAEKPCMGLASSRELLVQTTDLAAAAYLDADLDVLAMAGSPGQSALPAAAMQAAAECLAVAALPGRTLEAALEQVVAAERPQVLADLLLVLAQPHKLRRLCTNCRTNTAADKASLSALGLNQSGSDLQLYKAVGCSQCAGTGYSGQFCLIQTIYPSCKTISNISSMLQAGKDSDSQLLSAVPASEMTTLRQAAISSLQAGLTSVEEVFRVLPLR